MPTIVACRCGARLRVPEAAQGRTLRCPKCRSTIAGSQEPGQAPERTGTARELGVSGTCPICQSTVAADQIVLLCPACGQVHHHECWSEVGGCSTYGCRRAPAVGKEAEQPDRPASAWGDYKQCPMCKEKIRSIALKCRYCGASFDTVDPLTAADLRDEVFRSANLRSVRIKVILLFVFSVLGVPAPVTLLIALCWVLPNRATLARAGMPCLILGYSSLAISALYSLLMILFAVSSL